MNAGKVALTFAMVMFLGAMPLFSQSTWSLGIRGGVMLGGPIPAESDPDSTDGSLAIGPSGGVFLRKEIAPRWQLQAGVNYAFKGATYHQLYRSDTMMAVEIFPGFTDTVPTYFYADVNGKMGLHYLDIPIQARWNIKGGSWLSFGGYVSALLGGKDAGTVDIQIGHGTFFPDTTTAFDNIAEIRRMDAGLVIGGTFELKQGLLFEISAQRSLRGLYRKGFLASQGLPEIPLYQTQFYFGLGWVF